MIAVISLAFGVDKQKSFWGNYYRDDGLITYLHFFGFFLFLSLFWKNKWKDLVVVAISFASVITSFWSIYLGFSFYILKNVNVNNWHGAIGGFFNQPKFLSGYLLITLPFVAYWFYQKNTSKLLVGALFIVQIIAIGLTFSLAGIIGAVIYCTYIVYGQIKNVKIKKLLVVLFLIFLFTSGYFIKNRFFFDQISNQGYVAQSRQRIIVKLLFASLKKPFLGWGWANVDRAFESVVYPYPIRSDIYVDKAHSALLEVMTTTGIFGLIAYLLIIFFTLKQLIKKIKSGSTNQVWWITLFSAFVIYLFHSQTNVISIQEELMFWLILGIVSCD